MERFVYPEQFPKVTADFPTLPGLGLHPPSALELKGAFATMLEEFYSDRFRDIIAEKFEVDLKDKPFMSTVRGYTGTRDGHMHTDFETQDHHGPDLSQQLLGEEGRQSAPLARGHRHRGLRQGDLADRRRAPGVQAFDRSWHGHLPFEGPRRSIQFNWVTDRFTAFKENARHFLGSKLKAAHESISGRTGQ